MKLYRSTWNAKWRKHTLRLKSLSSSTRCLCQGIMTERYRLERSVGLQDELGYTKPTRIQNRSISTLKSWIHWLKRNTSSPSLTTSESSKILRRDGMLFARRKPSAWFSLETNMDVPNGNTRRSTHSSFITAKRTEKALRPQGVFCTDFGP